MAWADAPGPGEPAEGSHEQPRVHIDQTKPMWNQVGKLGVDYWDWVHKAEPGRARFFPWDALELLTVSVWWLGPACFVPLILAVLWVAYSTGVSSEGDIVSGLCLGFVLWQVHEYATHRFIFHHETTSPVWIALHFVLHGSHHKYPMDKHRCVFPPVPAAAVMTFWWLTLGAATPAALFPPIWGGLVAGFLIYDLTHYALHMSMDLPGDFLKVLRSRHNVHHYKNPDHAYGVSSEVFDLLFNSN